MTLLLETIKPGTGSFGRAGHETKGIRRPEPSRVNRKPEARIVAMRRTFDEGLDGLAVELASAMRRSKLAAAARLIIQAETEGAFQRCKNVARWLIGALGRSDAGTLLDALARSGCVACERGYRICEQCHGSGTFEQTGVCDRCIGIGVTPCEFCAGSGLITSEVFPATLQPAVAIDRAERAVKHTNRLIEDSLFQAERDDAGGAQKKWMKLLLEVERELRVLGNAVIVLEQTGRVFPHLKGRVTKAMARFTREGMKADSAVHVCLRALHSCAQRDAAAADEGSSARRWAENKLAFYRDLTKSDAFAGTGFDRTALTKAIENLVYAKGPPASGAAAVANRSLPAAPPAGEKTS